MMGVTFASVGPMLSMAAAPDVGLLGIYGAVIAAGVFAVIVAPFMGRLLPLFPAGGDRHHHPGDRHLADAGRDQLGGRRFADPDQGRRRRVGGVSQSKLRPASGAGHRAVRAAGDPRPDPLVHRLRRQRGGAARDHCGRGAGHGARRHAFRPGRGRALGRCRHAVPFRRAEISDRSDHHHVHRDGRRDDRVDRHVPRARRNDRPKYRSAPRSRADCAPTASARYSAASSTPSPTRRSRRMSGSSA